MARPYAQRKRSMRALCPQNASSWKPEDRRRAALILVNGKVHRIRSLRQSAAAAVGSRAHGTGVGYGNRDGRGAFDVRGRDNRCELARAHIGGRLRSALEIRSEEHTSE